MKTSRSEETLFEIANEQQGYFTTKQAIKSGYQDAIHPYHVRYGNWIREWRGIYRLSRYPLTDDGQYVLWSLWSRNRKNILEGVYSHETALSLFEISDIMPSKLHMTVPKIFRRHSKIPDILILHRGEIFPEEIEIRDGYSVTKPARTIVDLIKNESVSIDIIQQAYNEGKKRGLLQNSDFKHYENNNKLYAKIKNYLGSFD